MEKLKSIFTGIFAVLVGAVTLFLLFFRKKPEQGYSNPLGDKLDKQAESLKNEIAKLGEDRKKPLEDKSLEDEIKYWEQQNKDKLQ